MALRPNSKTHSIACRCGKQKRPFCWEYDHRYPRAPRAQCWGDAPWERFSQEVKRPSPLKPPVEVHPLNIESGGRWGLGRERGVTPDGRFASCTGPGFHCELRNRDGCCTVKFLCVVVYARACLAAVSAVYPIGRTAAYDGGTFLRQRVGLYALAEDEGLHTC